MADNNRPLTQVEVVRINLSITEWASLLVRLSIASIPAAVILTILGFGAFVLLSITTRFLGF